MDAITLLAPAPVASPGVGIDGTLEQERSEAGSSDFAALLAAGMLPQQPMPGVSPVPPADCESEAPLEHAALEAAMTAADGKSGVMPALPQALAAQTDLDGERAGSNASVAHAAGAGALASGGEASVAAETASFAAAAVPNAANRTEEREMSAVAASVAGAEPSTAQSALPQALIASGGESRLSEPSALLEVSAPVDTPEFAPALARQVVWMADKDAQIAEIRIDPPELGPVQVRLTLSGDEASVQLSAAHAEARSALEASLVKLREALAEAGIQLGEASVSAESFRDRSGAAAAREQRTAYDDGEHENGARALPAASPLPRRGLVDLFA